MTTNTAGENTHKKGIIARLLHLGDEIVEEAIERHQDEKIINEKITIIDNAIRKVEKGHGNSENKE